MAMRDRFAGLAARWSKLGHELGLGIGIATGYATLGRIGFYLLLAVIIFYTATYR